MDTNLLSMTLQSLLALAFVLGLFALLVWALRRFQMPGASFSNPDFRVLRRLHIDSKHSLVEIRHEGRRYLLTLSQTGISQLDHTISLPDADDDEVPGSKHV